MTKPDVFKTQSRHFNIEEVAAGVYAAIAVPDTGSVANAAIVNLGDSVLIFDTFNSQQAAADLREVAESLTGLPIGYVVNSHWHGDHIRGNQAFRDVPIIASVKTYEEMARIHPDRIAKQQDHLPKFREDLHAIQEKLQNGVEEDRVKLQKDASFLTEFTLSLETLELVLPSITFEEHYTISGSQRTVELVTYGGGHTICDAFLYVQDEKVLILGDLVGINNHVMLADGNPTHWVEILKQIQKFDCEKVICGHGPVGTGDAVKENLQYLTDLLSISEQFIRSGQEVEAVKHLQMPERYQSWQADFLFHRNLEFLYRLIKSEK